MAEKSGFLNKVLDRLTRLDAEGLQKVVHQLAVERNFLETLLQTIEDGVLVADAEGKIIYLNQAVTRLLGLNPETTRGRRVVEVMPELDWERLSATDLAGGQRVVRHELEIGYPKPRFLRLFAAPLDGDSKGSTGMALILHDATEARQKTFEAIESERVQALTLLAASVAHEIGNPLNALHIHLQLIERDLRKLREPSAVPPPPTVKPTAPRIRGKTSPAKAANPAVPPNGEALEKLQRYVDVAKGEIARLDYIVTQFLQALRPSPPQLKQASLNASVRETYELLRPELENRGLVTRLELGRQLPDVPIDPAQVKQVLVNLIKNSMQAMTRGGCLTLETGQTGDGVWARVADDGVGIPSDQLNRIFEPFYTTKKKGSGLGLMIVHRIMREHGGRIEVSSVPDKGTAFRLWFPLRDRGPRLLSTGGGEAPRPGDHPSSSSSSSSSETD